MVVEINPIFPLLETSLRVILYCIPSDPPS